MDKSKKIIWLDYVRFYACCFVVLLHVCAFYINNYGTIPQNFWNTANIIESFTRICVPLFFMISGYIFFSDKVPKPKNFIKLFSSLVFYSLIALVLFFIAKKLAPNTIKLTTISFFKEPAFYHLWFFYPLICIYIFACFVKVRNIGIVQIFAYSFLIFVILNPRTSNVTEVLFNHSIENIFMIDGVFIYYLSYGLIGGMIKNCTSEVSFSKKWMIYAAIILSILLSAFVSLLNRLNYINKTNDYFSFFDFNSPLIFLITILFFISIKSIDYKTEPNRIIHLISNNSLAIYGIHAFVLSIIKSVFKYQNYNPLYTIPIVFLLTLFISLGFSICIKPFDKKRLLS